MEIVTAKHLAMLGLNITRALAEGKHADLDISISTVARHANEGRLLSSLESALAHGDDVWLGWLTDERRAALEDEWARIANTIAIEEYGLTRRTPGLYLVLVLIFEGIKTRDVPRMSLEELVAGSRD
jgi:hypothetical protein